MTAADVINAVFDGLLFFAFLVAVMCVAAAVEVGAWIAGVELAAWRARRHERRRRGYITDEILGPPWRHR